MAGIGYSVPLFTWSDFPNKSLSLSASPTWTQVDDATLFIWQGGLDYDSDAKVWLTVQGWSGTNYNLAVRLQDDDNAVTICTATLGSPTDDDLRLTRVALGSASDLASSDARMVLEYQTTEVTAPPPAWGGYLQAIGVTLQR